MALSSISPPQAYLTVDMVANGQVGQVSLELHTVQSGFHSADKYPSIVAAAHDEAIDWMHGDGMGLPRHTHLPTLGPLLLFHAVPVGQVCINGWF